MDKEMMKALEADGEKLRQLTGEDHGPWAAPEPWSYLETTPAANAPASDNPSGLYCPACREAGMAHCSEPEWCGGMRMMKPHTDQHRD